jgi:hypothetical protein
MEKDFGVTLEFNFLAFNIRKVVCGVQNSFLSFLKKFNERKTHNILVLMLDPSLVFSFISHDQGVAIVEQYDTTFSLYRMFMKFYYHLHPSTKFYNGFAYSRVDDDNTLKNLNDIKEY